MRVKILFDIIAVDDTFSRGWGFSCLINERILFDTGQKSAFLANNMAKLHVKSSDLKSVVISHDHWDHTGGLWGLLKENPSLKVYGCRGFSDESKDRVRSCGIRLLEVSGFSRICKGVYTSGAIKGRGAYPDIYEQALVLKTDNGITILTGCAHPGIINIIEQVKQNISDNIYCVLGGFHLKGKHRKTINLIADKLKELGVKKIAPAHCTGETAVKIFKERYGADFMEAKAGLTIEV